MIIFGGIHHRDRRLFYGRFDGFVVYRDLKIARLPKIFKTTVTGTVVLMFITGLFSWVITRE